MSLQNIAKKLALGAYLEMDRMDGDTCQWYVNVPVVLPGTDIFENKYRICICRHWH